MLHWDSLCMLSNKYCINSYCDVAEIRFFLIIGTLIDGSLFRKIPSVRILDCETLTVRKMRARPICMLSTSEAAKLVHI